MMQKIRCNCCSGSGDDPDEFQYPCMQCDGMGYIERRGYSTSAQTRQVQRQILTQKRDAVLAKLGLVFTKSENPGTVLSPLTSIA